MMKNLQLKKSHHPVPAPDDESLLLEELLGDTVEV
jgi:hypothetical protein